jgi:hypothetical protein
VGASGGVIVAPMQGPPSRERIAMLALWALAATGCLLGAAAAASPDAELVDLLRVVCTAALVVVLMLGPGVLWRLGGGRPIGLGFLALPGLALLAAVGGLAWLFADAVDPRTLCFACCAPLLGLILGALVASSPEDVFEPEEQRALLLTSLALIFAVARSIWSLGPADEFLGGTVSRTFISEGRPDSRTSFHVVQLIANGAHANGTDANALFAPYNFSSRGPLPGMAAAPVVLLSGGSPPLGLPEQPWRPFDAQGFMAFRIAMIGFSCGLFLALWDLVRRLGGFAAARLALLLAISTPFLFADLWFTWPKLLGATFVLLAAILLIERKAFRSGLAVGAGFLAHPSALSGLFGLGPISLWPLRGASWKRPQITQAVLLVLGAALMVFFWRKVNEPFLRQDQFFEYVRQAYPEYHPALGDWLVFRGRSLANTLVPLFLPLADGGNVSINVPGGDSPGVVRFFFQYWTAVPFAFAIVFLPMLLVSLWRALRRWTWAVTATILIPFAAFAIYWGASSSGLLREGLQFWVLAVLAVVALQQASAGFTWFRSLPARIVLVARVGEVLLMALAASLAAHGLNPLSDEYRLHDAVALLGMVGAAAAIGWTIWRGTMPSEGADARSDG